MTPPTAYEVAGLLLGAGAFILSLLRFRDGRKRPMPKVSLSFSPIADFPGWEVMTINVRNRANVEVTLDMIKVACFSKMRLLESKDRKGNPWDEPEPLEINANLASRRLPLDIDIPPGGQISKSLFVLRKRRCIFPMFRWADSTSHFTLQIHIA